MIWENAIERSELHYREVASFGGGFLSVEVGCQLLGAKRCARVWDQGAFEWVEAVNVKSNVGSGIHLSGGPGAFVWTNSSLKPRASKTVRRWSHCLDPDPKMAGGGWMQGTLSHEC
jgi:hypothetical protein